MQRNPSTREQRATDLLTAGAVTLFVGRGYALVAGSKGNVYRVTKAGCECSDFRSRGMECKHLLAVKRLCAEYHALKARAEQGERVTPSAALLAALRWLERPAPVRPAASGRCTDCGAPAPKDLCADCFLGYPPAAVAGVKRPERVAA